MARWIEQIRLYPIPFVKSLAIYSTLLSLGLTLGIIGPTLLDLRTQVNTDLTQVATVIPARAGGYVAGSFIMGFLYEKVNVMLYSGVATGISCIVTALTPHIKELYPLLSMFFLNGLVLGGFEAASNALMLTMWGKEIGPFMSAFDFSYGVGAFIAPMIAQPFLLESETDDDVPFQVNFNETNGMNTTSFINSIDSPDELKLAYPYTIIALVLLFNSVFFFIMWFLHPQTQEHPSRVKAIDSSTDSNGDQLKTSNNNSNPLSDVKKYKTSKVLVIICSMFFLHTYYAIQLTIGSFLVTYAVESDLKLTKHTGVNMTALFWACFTFFRLALIFYFEYVGGELNLIGCLVLVGVGNVFLIPFGNSSPLCLWIGTAFIGLGISSIWPSLFGYLEENFKITSKISSCMIVSAMIGEFIVPMVISYYVVDYPGIFLYVTLFCSVCLVVLFTCIVLIMRLRLQKFRPQVNHDNSRVISVRKGTI